MEFEFRYIRSCTCGDSYQTDETAALGHDLTETVMEPSDGSIDNVLYECTRCDYSCTGHTHVYTTTVVDPTCTEAGYTRNACICGDTYQSDPTPATGHTYTSVVTPPTCTEKGYTTHTCHCGDSYQDNLIDALGHHYYTNKYGIELCSRCGDILETIPLLPDPTPGEEIMSAGVGTATMAIAESTERTLDSTIVQEYGYVYTGGKLMQMVVKTTTTPVDGEPTTTTETLNFTYDASGIPMSVDYNGMDYYYVTNIQGDIVAILNTSGAAVVEYTYDAWGNIHAVNGTLADTLGEVNPLRYRGYVYDNETEYYYLQSRYYDPEVGRFINADGLVSTGCGLLGYNLFTYCNSNPIVYADSTGAAPWPTTVVICEGGCNYKPNPFDETDPAYGGNRYDGKDTYYEMTDRGVRLEKNPSGGGVVHNSYMVTDRQTIYEMSEIYLAENPEMYDGQVDGFAYEWWIHSTLYYVFSYTGSDFASNAEHYDFGKSVFDDPRLIIKLLYFVVDPESAIVDYYNYIAWEEDQ